MTPKLALSDALDSRWARRGNRTAIREDHREITYRELLRWSQTLSLAIEPLLREPGRRVALVLPNSASFVASFFAIARLGGVAAPLSTHYRSQELAYYLDDLDTAAVLADPASMERLITVIPDLKRAPALFELTFGEAPRPIRPGQGAARPLPAGDSPPLIQLYTSGSTGTPKRVVRTHSGLLAELETLRATFETTDADRFLGVAPFSHVNGLVRTMMTAMYAGATLYPVVEFRRREVLELMTSERMTFVGAVPQIFSILGRMPAGHDVDLSTLRLAFSSSAPLLPADCRRFLARYGIALRQLYGSSETGTISYNRDPFASCDESVGLPLEGVRALIIGENGQPVPPGIEGEVAIASPFAASGYLDNENATRENFRDGVYFSGDLGTKDAHGRLKLTGRKKLMLNRGGFKVNPYEVEAAIREHPGVADVVVYGAPSPQGDDLVCAAIVPSGACTAEEIMAHCRERIADFKIPARIEMRDALPRSATGKILRSQL
jgi:long-chain acyl-CoA synthetase